MITSKTIPIGVRRGSKAVFSTFATFLSFAISRNTFLRNGYGAIYIIDYDLAVTGRRAMTCSRFRLLIAAIVSGACLAAVAVDTLAAQTYPTRPVRMVIGYAAGGPTDSLGRIVAQKLGEILGKSFVVENRPGAGGTIGAAVVAKAAADGYTLFFDTIGGLAVNQHVYKSLPYDARKDFTPIGPVASGAVLPLGEHVPPRAQSERADRPRKEPTREIVIRHGGPWPISDGYWAGTIQAEERPGHPQCSL